jgi:hypothetical protein
MTYTEAHTEFCLRLYRWAKGALGQEISEGFPRFQLNKNWSKLRCQFLQTLDHQSRVAFSQGILQARHQHAAKALGETILAEAEMLMRLEEAFRSKNNDWTRLSSAQVGGGKQNMPTRRALKKVISAHFRTAFETACVPPDSTEKNKGLRFQMVCHGWTITTEFEFGRWDTEITCVHDVWTGKLITKDEPSVLFANCLGFQMNYGNELGIGSGWEDITIDNVELTCLSVMEHCQRMLRILPELLDDFDLQRLSK